MKAFNKPELAEQLKLKIIEAEVGPFIMVDVKDLPQGWTIDDFIRHIEETHIAFVDKKR